MSEEAESEQPSRARVGYDTIGRQWLEDNLRRVSGSGYKVFTYLRSMRDDENYCFPSIERIAERAGISTSTTKQAIKELEGLRWISIEMHSRKGSVIRHAYRILTGAEISPVNDDRAEDHPGTGAKIIPDRAENHPGHRGENRPVRNTIQGTLVEVTEQNPPATESHGLVKSSRPAYRELGISDELWAAFEDMRTKQRAKLTPYAANLICKKLATFQTAGHDPVAILETTVMQGWKGVFAPNPASSAANSHHRGIYATCEQQRLSPAAQRQRNSNEAIERAAALLGAGAGAHESGSRELPEPRIDGRNGDAMVGLMA